ncbi:MAG: MBL fold metallo-hydrolase [Terriglobia bacterium]
MRLTFLGTGTSTGVPVLACHCATCTSPDSRDKRTRPSILLEFDGHVVVIDTSPDFREQGLREGLERVDAVLFTHTHADHIFGLDDIRVFNFRQKQAIPIFGDQNSIDSIRRIFDYIFRGSYIGGGIPKLDVHVIDGPFELWGKRLTPLPVFHGDLPILGFRFDHTAYVTDFSAIPETTMAMLEGLDVLILDALRHKPHPTHSTVENSLEIVARLNPKRAFFTHIAHELSHAATDAALPAHVHLAYDGLQLDL